NEVPPIADRNLNVGVDASGGCSRCPVKGGGSGVKRCPGRQIVHPVNQWIFIWIDADESEVDRLSFPDALIWNDCQNRCSIEAADGNNPTLPCIRTVWRHGAKFKDGLLLCVWRR